MISIKLITRRNFCGNKLKDFLLLMDKEYPIPLSLKVDFGLFLKQIKEKGNVYCAFDNNKIIGTLFFYDNNI